MRLLSGKIKFEAGPSFEHVLVLAMPANCFNRSKSTEEVFFVQNAGAPAAGTGLNKSAIIQKISLAQAASVSNQRNATGMVEITTVNSNPTVINPNGAWPGSSYSRIVACCLSRPLRESVKAKTWLQGQPTIEARLFLLARARARASLRRCSLWSLLLHTIRQVS